MAEPGRNIEIQIAATGGDQAAAEIRKAAVSHEDLNRSLGIVLTSEGELASRRSQFLTAAEAEVAEINRETAALDRMEQEAKAAAAAMHAIPSAKLEGGFENIAEAGKKVTSSAVSMRMGLQNAGYQIQDIAVQAEMGTPALRIMGQQLPQLLGGFGLWGAVAGSVIALGAPLAASFMQSGDGAENAKGKVKSFSDVMDDYAEAAETATRKRDVDSLGEWFGALDDEDEKIKRNNESLEKSIELQTKLNVLKRGVEAAQRDLAIANIESDPNLTDAEKTRQVAAYREKDERRKAEAKIEDLNNGAAAAGRSYDAAQGEADRKAADAEAAKRKREELEAEQAAASERARIATEVIPEIEKKLRDTAAQNQAAVAGVGSGFVKPETLAAGRAEEEKLRQQLENAKKQVGTDPLPNLTPEQAAKKAADDEALVTKAQAEEKKVSEEAKAAREAAQKAYSEKLYKEAEAREMAPLIEEQYRTQSASRSVRTETKATEQEAADLKKEEQKKKREDDKAKRDRGDDLKERLDGAEDSLDDAAKKRGRQIKDEGKRSGNDTLKGIGDKLLDGTNGGEIEKIGEEIKDAQGKLAGSTVATLAKILAELKASQQQIETIKGQIKNNRNGK